MKKIILPLVLLVASFTVKAQIARGSTMLGGDIGYNQNNSESTVFGTDKQENKYSSFRGQASFGCLFTDHLMLGIQVGYESYNSLRELHSKYYNSTESQLTETIMPGIFARYYQRIGESRFYLFAQLAASYNITTGNTLTRQNGSGTYTDQVINTKSSGVNIKLIPGVVCMVSNKVGISASVGNFGYETSKGTSKIKGIEILKTTNNNIYSNLGFSSIYLGVNFYFGSRNT